VADIRQPDEGSLTAETKSQALYRLGMAYVAFRVAEGGYGPVTAANARKVIRSFTDVTDVAPARLKAEHFEDWRASKRLTSEGLRTQLSILRNWCRWMVAKDHLRRDPMATVRNPRRARAVPRSRTAEEVARILDAAPTKRERLIVLLMVQEGLRCGEVSRLEAGDVDFERRSVRVVGKGGHHRLLPISEETWRALLDYLEGKRNYAGPLVRSFADGKSGITPHTIGLLVRGVMREAGVPGSAHSLRHTAASDVLERCGDITVVKEMLGHASISTTEIYLRTTSAARLRDAMSGRAYEVDL
jgi:site-specific recombinase XerD